MKTKKFFARTLRHIFASVLVAASGSSSMAHAQTTITQARQKISSNLLREIERLCGQKLTQVKDDKNNGRLVKALVISNRADPSLTAMRQANPRGGRLGLLSLRFRGWHFGNAASQPAD